MSNDRLVFGADLICPTCKGSGAEHAFHVDDNKKHIPCEHPCPHCKGKCVVRL